MSADGPITVTVDTGLGQPVKYSLRGEDTVVKLRFRARDLLRD